jgi:hypothetical protein
VSNEAMFKQNKTNMNDAQLKLSSQICFHHSFRSNHRRLQTHLDEMGLRIRNIHTILETMDLQTKLERLL